MAIIDLLLKLFLNCMLKSLKRIICWLDIFNQPPGFRFKQEPCYQSLTGGCCSFIVIVVFMGLFFSTALDTFNKVQIFSTTTRVQQFNPELLTLNTSHNFMFAIGITGINVNENKRYFDFFMEDRTYINGKKSGIKTPLQKCQKSHWQSYGQNFLQIYDRIGFQQWLCPPKNYTFSVEGKYTSQIFKHHKFSVVKCNQTLSSRNCANETQMQQFLTVNEAFTFKFYFINTLLNPGSNEPVSQYMEDINYFNFNLKSGITANLFISTYQMETDQSIWPFSTKKITKGGVFLNVAQSFAFDVNFNQYLKFYIRKASTKLQIQRSFQKAESTLSYIGGLFSAIIGALFFIHKYNQLAYELEMSKYFFYQDSEKPYDYEGFNFLKYICYSIYDLFKTIKIQLPWPKMKAYDDAFDEVRQQLDIRLIVKKICFLDKFSTLLLSNSQANILHLQEPIKIQTARKIRKKHTNYYRLKKKINKIVHDKEIKRLNTNKIHPRNQEISEGNQEISQQYLGFPDLILPDNSLKNPIIDQFIKSFQQLELQKMQNNISRKILNNTDEELQKFYQEYKKKKLNQLVVNNSLALQTSKNQQLLQQQQSNQ